MTTVKDVGEFGLIDQITRDLTFGPEVLIGPGDDAAVFTLNGPAAWSTDSLVENLHFRRNWSSPFDVGRKAIAVSVADVEAMGARPVGVLVALSIPSDLPTDWATAFTAGVKDECRRSGAALLGGDITGARDITINVSVLGDLYGRPPVTRSGAQLGDVVAVIGNLGMAAAGLAVLNRGFRSPKDVVLAHRCPEPPYGMGASVAGIAHAMIDVSDGLIADLTQIAVASGVVIELETSLLEVGEPQQVVAAALGRIDPLSFVLTGGEDHALAACFAPNQVPSGWRRIGTVSGSADPGAVLVDNKPWVGSGGWVHF